MHLQENTVFDKHSVIGVSSGITYWQDVNCGTTSHNFVSQKQSLSPNSIHPSCIETSWYDNSIYYIAGSQLAHTSRLDSIDYTQTVGTTSHITISQGGLTNENYAQENGVWVAGNGVITLYDTKCEFVAQVNGVSSSVASLSADTNSVYIADNTNQIVYQCDNNGKQVSYCTYATAGVSSIVKMCSGCKNYVWVLTSSSVTLLYFYPEYPVSVVWSVNISDIVDLGFTGIDMDVHAYQKIGYITCNNGTISTVFSLDGNGALLAIRDVSSIGDVQIVRVCQSPSSHDVVLLTGSVALPLKYTKLVERMHQKAAPSLQGLYFADNQQNILCSAGQRLDIVSKLPAYTTCWIAMDKSVYFVGLTTKCLFHKMLSGTTTELGVPPPQANKMCKFGTEIWLSDDKTIWCYDERMILQRQHVLYWGNIERSNCVNMCCDEKRLYLCTDDAVFYCDIDAHLAMWMVKKLINKPFVTKGNLIGIGTNNSELYVADAVDNNTRVFMIHLDDTPHYTLGGLYHGTATRFVGVT